MRRFITLDQALALVTGKLPSIKVGVERVALLNAMGRILAEDVTSPIDVPPFDKSKMDGYAVRASDTFGADELNPVSLKVVGDVKVGQPPSMKITKGTAASVSTGAAIPAGADGVVMIENAHREGNVVHVHRAIVPGENVLKKGSDVRRGQTILGKNQRVSVKDVMVMASVGLPTVSVKQLKVSVLSTGSELMELGFKLPPAKIYDVNTSAICAELIKLGCTPISLGVVKDDRSDIEEAIKKCLSVTQVIVTTGSTSVGVEDVMMDVLNSLGRPGVIVEGLAIKPGKPTMVAVVDDKLVFALPGRPFSAIIVFNLLVKPVLRKVLNLPEEGVEVEATAGARIYAERGKRTFATVKLKKEAGKVMAYPVEMESETVTMLSRAHGYVEVAEDREFVERGKKVRVRLFE